jgi:hypothetical protein
LCQIRKFDAVTNGAAQRFGSFGLGSSALLSGRRSAVDGRTARHAGYAVSQRKRKRIEEPFGLGQDDRRTCAAHASGVEKLGFKFTLTMAGYNLIRLPKLIAAQA